MYMHAHTHAHMHTVLFEYCCLQSEFYYISLEFVLTYLLCNMYDEPD